MMIEFPIHIVGSGAVGSLITAKAIQQNIDAIQIVRHSSLTNSVVVLDNESIALTNKTLISHVSQIEFLVLPVKAFDVEPVLTSIRPLLKHGAQVVITHNGLGTLETSKRLIGDIADIYFCTTSTGAYTDGNSVFLAGKGLSQWSTISLCPHKTEARAFVTQIVNALFYHASYVENLNVVLWSKLAVNSVINPITAIENIINGDVLKPQYDELIDKILLELIMVANKNGIALSFQSLKESVVNVATNTKNNSSSMRQDVLAKRKTEIDFINGYIVELAKQYDIDVPANHSIVEKVKELVLL